MERFDRTEDNNKNHLGEPTEGGKKKKYIIGILAAVIVVCVLVFVLFNTGILRFGNIDMSVGGGWGDSDNGRPSYTIDQINSGILADTITFNSISDGKFGDEKNFVAAKVASEDVKLWNANSIKVQDGETYTIRLYLHNNNPNGKDAVALDVKTTFSLPVEISTQQTIIGYLDSSNAKPSRYWDGVTLVSDTPFFIEYVEDSARFTNTNFSGVELGNDIIISGALVGYNDLDGKIPGCYEYDGLVTIDVVVHESK